MILSDDKIKLMIADDHSLIRMGLISLIDGREDIVLIGQVENGQQAIDMAADLKPDVILMDINMPGVNGLDATKHILESTLETRILILTVSANDQDLFDAIGCGASGYLLKNITSEELCDAIVQVYNGEVIIPQVFMGRILQQVVRGSSSDTKAEEKLTAREQELLIHLVTGASNKEIADSLHLSEYTVKIHISNILSKLQLKNRIQAAVYALRKGITE